MSAGRRARNKRRKKLRVRTNRRFPACTADRALRAVGNAQQVGRLKRWLLPHEGIFASLRLHGNTKWTPTALVWLALCWGWAEPKHVTDCFERATEQCRLLGVMPLSTYQGFMNALVTWTDRLMSLLWPLLHRCMREIGGEFWQISGWVPIAFDGSRSSAPRTQSNEQALCAANYGNGKTAKYRKKKTKGMRRRKNEKNKPQPQKPQAWITLLWHMGLRLPWMWRLGPSDSSERTHVMEMLEQGEFRKNTLFCGDAGFVGYPLWSKILSCSHQFLVRVGANVSLLAEAADYTIGDDGLVLCWPKAAMDSGQPPLRLRLVKIRINQTWMWMLTSVRDATKLTKSQIIHLYELRWGVELEFRGLKQTLDHGKLCCRNSDRLLAELNWSIMAMAVAELFALKEQLAPDRPGPTGDPTKRSLANTMRALRSCLRNLRDIPDVGHDLSTRLRLAVTDSYIRRSSKKARYRPPNPDKRPLGDPKVRPLTTEQRKKLRATGSKAAA
jgi:Transposase DDE domain